MFGAQAGSSAVGNTALPSHKLPQGIRIQRINIGYILLAERADFFILHNEYHSVLTS